MKKLLLLAVCLYSFGIYAQKDKDDVTYYTDSQVKNSRFSIALTLNPNYTDRRIIGDDLTRGGGLDLADENASGAFQFNYNAGFFFEVGSALDIGLGVGKSFGEYAVKNAKYYTSEVDTMVVDVRTNVSMWTIPLKLNFNTRVTDVLELEVVPVIEFNIVDKYDQTITPVDGSASFALNRADETRSLNTTVGIGLGGTYVFTENWGVFFRGNVKYMLNPLIDQVGYPRESLYSFGADVGIKYSF